MASGFCLRLTTRLFGFMIPAFCAAIASSVSPSAAIWSMLMDASTQTRGSGITLVESIRPPIPASAMAISHFFSWNHTKARAVSTSKAVGWGKPSPESSSAARLTRSMQRENSVFAITLPFIRNMSRCSRSSGELKDPVRYPARASTPESIASTLPFPFVPAI